MEMMANIYTAQTPQFGVSKVTFEISFGVSNEDFYSARMHKKIARKWQMCIILQMIPIPYKCCSFESYIHQESCLNVS